jgi:hypothetical protein
MGPSRGTDQRVSLFAENADSSHHILVTHVAIL